MKIFQTTQYIFLVAILTLFGYYIFCITYPYNVVDIKGAVVDHKEYKVGDDLHYTVNYCKYMPIKGVVFSELADGVVYNLKGTVSNSAVGCGEKIMTVGRTPDVPAGKYHISIRAVYQVNPFRQITVTYQTNEFEIISNEK